MSSMYTVHVVFDVVFSAMSVRSISEALVNAIADNWLENDEWSTPTPEFPLSLADCERACRPESMEFNDWPTGPEDWYWVSEELGVSFSPLYSGACGIRFYRLANDSLEIHFSFNRDVLYEVLGRRELDRVEEQLEKRLDMLLGKTAADTTTDENNERDEIIERLGKLYDTPAAWPQIKKHIHHILDKLRAALPVAYIEIDDLFRSFLLDEAVSTST